GMLVVRTRSEAERLSWTRLMSFSDRPGTTWIDGEGHPAASNALRFTATIDYSAAAAIFQGARRSLDQVLTDAAHRGSRPDGFALPGSARLERDGANATRFSSPNILAVLPGSDPALAGEYVLLMAHLDGLGVRESGANENQGGDRIRNGAMDNASGVATLIEVAQAMVRSGHRPRRPVLF